MDNGTAPAEPATPERRPRPGRPPGSKNGSGQQKNPALYHLFQKGDKGQLLPVGSMKARTAAQAADGFLNTPPSGQKEFAKHVTEGKARIVVVPDRNITEIGAEEKVRRSVTLKVIK